MDQQTQPTLKLIPGNKWQYKSRSATGPYWYDLEKGRHINNARFQRRYEIRQVKNDKLELFKPTK